MMLTLSNLYHIALILGLTDATTTNNFNIAFYNTGQSRNILDSVNDISGNNPPKQQSAQIEEIKRESSELELDVLCLSDLLLSKQLYDYKEALSNEFPYSLSQLDIKPKSDFETPRTACTAWDFVKFQSEGNCTQAALKKCDEILRKLPEDGSLDPSTGYQPLPATNTLEFQICLAQECPYNYDKILYSECKSCMTIFTTANNNNQGANHPGMALGTSYMNESVFTVESGPFSVNLFSVTDHESFDVCLCHITYTNIYRTRLMGMRYAIRSNYEFYGWCFDFE